MTLDPEKVQWSAIDVDDDSNVFKYPKDLNATVEGYYHAYKHEDGPAECKGPGGYTYNLKDMRQIQGDRERILKREELSPPSVEVKSNHSEGYNYFEIQRVFSKMKFRISKSLFILGEIIICSAFH